MNACIRMSAASLALTIAPTFGAAAPAPRRGAETRAANADFTKALDDAAAADAPAPIAPKSRAEATTETPPQTPDDAPDETLVEDASPVDALPSVLAVPTPAPQTIPVESVAKDQASSIRAPAVAAPPMTDLPTTDDTAEPAVAPPPSQPEAVEAATIAAAQVAVVSAPAGSTPAPAPIMASVASRAAKTGDTATIALPEAAEEPEIDADGGAPVRAGFSPLAAEAPRVRDAIDRAQTLRSEAAPAASTTPASTPSPDPAGSGTDKATTPAAPARTPTLAEAPVSAPSTAAAETSPLAVQAEAVRLEARATEASTLALSTTSRASVETTAHIAARIIKTLEARSTRFEMALTPDDLGRVDVSLDIDADGQLAARLAFDNPVAATELRGRVDELRRQLQEAGFTVADDALSFSQRDSSTGQGGAFDRGQGARNARAFGAASRLSADADLAAVSSRWIPLTLTPDRVDMKV